MAVLLAPVTLLLCCNLLAQPATAPSGPAAANPGTKPSTPAATPSNPPAKPASPAAPAAGSPATPAAPAVTPATPATGTPAKPAAPSDATQTIEQMEKKAPVGPGGASGTSTGGAGSAQPAQPTTAPQPIASAGSGKLLREGSFLASRRGRVIKATGGEWQFHFDAGTGAAADGKAEAPIVLMPCLNLQAMEKLAERGGETMSFTVSGQIFVYKGRNYLLPSLYTVNRRTEITPAQ